MYAMYDMIHIYIYIYDVYIYTHYDICMIYCIYIYIYMYYKCNSRLQFKARVTSCIANGGADVSFFYMGI